MDIPTQYNPRDVEERWYKFWDEKGFFRANPGPKTKKPYSIVIPPPNVTGILHMGHALNNTIQDIYCRFYRMNGYETLWMPGTDHAGIATQNVVEKMLIQKGIKRHDLGREEFLKEVWKWKEGYGSTIINQLKSLGCSCDWGRTRFTMDETFSDAVLEVFIRLYKKGLIYRGNYIINWCPRCQTALSDEEAEHREVDGMLYFVKYPIKNTRTQEHKNTLLRQGFGGQAEILKKTKETPDYVVVATTRPETMLGDVALCINPKDKRYAGLKEKKIILPLLNRELRVICDAKVDPSFGTGVLKVTPAHDPVDFELGLTHNLEPINVMNDNATMNDLAGEYRGMDRFECRKTIVEDLKDRGLFLKAEPHRHAVGHCYRCHTMVEPRLSKQWFVRMKPLALKAKEVVEDGKIKFYPGRWTKVYLNWMTNIRDWCISRQIWWGHRIPVYYCTDCVEKQQITPPLLTNCGVPLSDSNGGTNNSASKSKITKEKGVIVSKTKPDKCPDCGSTRIEQDPDVLDTWFSSWLWPFATFGWPFDKHTSAQAHQRTRAQDELKYFYPTNVLVTAQEIIFFWVARMIMAGLEFMKDVPFRDVYIHGTVRDDTGTKMSKSLGNVIDPIDIIKQFGSDALRFSIISITAQGQDVFLSPQRFEIGRNFANKLWNASRLVLLNLDKEKIKVDLCQFEGDPSLTLADKWILSRFYQALEDFERSIKRYRINDAANRVYEFLWHEFCDWYLELAKITIQEAHTQITLYKVLEKSLRMLHPIMPFITEDIWQRFPREHGTNSIMITKWPRVQKPFISKSFDAEMDLLISIIQAVRNLRATWRIEHSKEVDIYLKAKKRDLAGIEKNAVYIKRLARVGKLELSTYTVKLEHAAFAVIGEVEISIPLEGIIDLDKEKRRLKEKLEHLESELGSVESKLKNKGFVSKAPEAVVKKAKDRKEELKNEVGSLNKNLSAL
ncbi:MAG: valine--tRNA ligase [Candidatus Omnitrophota bacterium]